MEYILLILLFVLVGLILTYTLRKRQVAVVWAFWVSYGIQMIYQFAFYSYRFHRMWTDIKTFLG